MWQSDAPLSPGTFPRAKRGAYAPHAPRNAPTSYAWGLRPHAAKNASARNAWGLRPSCGQEQGVEPTPLETCFIWFQSLTSSCRRPLDRNSTVPPMLRPLAKSAFAPHTLSLKRVPQLGPKPREEASPLALFCEAHAQNWSRRPTPLALFTRR